jgi:hypothetical protein
MLALIERRVLRAAIAEELVIIEVIGGVPEYALQEGHTGFQIYR